jgi:hypothetical protein
MSAHGFTRRGKAQRAQPDWHMATCGNSHNDHLLNFKKKINPIVVVEAVETGEIDHKLSSQRLCLPVWPGDRGSPFAEIDPFSTVSRA